MDIITDTIVIRGAKTAEEITTVMLQSLIRMDISGEMTFPTETEKWDIIRKVRNDLLSQCDWLIVKSTENDILEIEKWKNYREILRELPQTYKAPEDVIFPDIPQYIKIVLTANDFD